MVVGNGGKQWLTVVLGGAHGGGGYGDVVVVGGEWWLGVSGGQWVSGWCVVAYACSPSYLGG